MNIKRGLLVNFYPSTYTADVLLLEATCTYLQGIPISTAVDGTSAIPNAYCAVLLFDEHNLNDGCVLCVYPNGTTGVPSPTPGRIVFCDPYTQLNAVAIGSGSTNTYTVAGGSTGIPANALGILFKAFFSSPTVGAYVQIAAHNDNINNHASIGNITVASSTLNGMGIVSVDANGQIDVKANGGACTVTLYTYGYVI